MIFREVDVLEFGAGAPVADFWAEFEVEGPSLYRPNGLRIALNSIGLRPKNRLFAFFPSEKISSRKTLTRASLPDLT